MKNMWKSAIMGVVTGDALGTPVQFESRAQVEANPVSGMIGYRTFNMPPGTWTDDSALTLATMDSIIRTGRVVDVDIMNNFVKWLDDGEFTPYGFAFDIGRGTMEAIKTYKAGASTLACGGRSARNNGNGSLMRIMPVVLYCIGHNYDHHRAIPTIHTISALTHAHSRACIACGLYYFMAHAIVKCNGSLIKRMQVGLDAGFAYYEYKGYTGDELGHFDRLRNLQDFMMLYADDIKTTGYVVDTLEAAVWGLITTANLDDCLLKLVNMGYDTDSVAAVAGGLAGLYYGYKAIPTEWWEVIQRRGWIEDMITKIERRQNNG